MFALPPIKPNWLMKSVLIAPLLVGLMSGGVWLASEPYCLHCMSSEVFISGLTYPGMEVVKYECLGCHQSWKPLNLHRYTPSGCSYVYK